MKGGRIIWASFSLSHFLYWEYISVQLTYYTIFLCSLYSILIIVIEGSPSAVLEFRLPFLATMYQCILVVFVSAYGKLPSTPLPLRRGTKKSWLTTIVLKTSWVNINITPSMLKPCLTCYSLGHDVTTKTLQSTAVSSDTPSGFYLYLLENQVWLNCKLPK